MRRFIILITAVVLGACARPTPAARALAETEANLEDIRSGRLRLSLTAGAGDATIGFEITGPFAVADEEGALPVLDLTYTRVVGARRDTSRLRSTGTRAYASTGDTWVALDRAQSRALEGRGLGGGGLEGLDLSEWFEAPSLDEGDGTDRLTGELDAVAALDDVLSLARRTADGVEVPERLEGDAAERVRRAVRSASARIATGADDRLLRSLSLDVRLGIADARLRSALGDLASTRIRLDLRLDDVNQPVDPPPAPV